MLPRHSFDAAYLQKLSSGDADTESHFARYFGELVRLKVRARLRSSSEAEDVSQETLLRVLRNVRAGSVDHPERLGAYVNTVSNHVMLELFRRDKRSNPMPEEEPAEIGAISAETLVLRAERATRVREAVADLPPKEREILRRMVVEEQDKDIICHDLQVTREYLRVLVHRSVEKLRVALGEKKPRTLK